jgi:AmmeMemoRadiSam system protein A
MEITDKEKKVLLFAARESIKKSFGAKTCNTIDYLLYPFLKLHLGAFVTLKIENELRGCIGYIFAKTTLYETVYEAAKQAAFSDPRFYPLTQDEFAKINIEISIISLPQKIKDYKEIIIGKHGLILEEGLLRAVLLPQVAVANNFLCDQFLTALCEKGGLPANTWQLKKLHLKTFTATIFSEIENNE